MYRLMENKVKRIGYLPRKRVLEIIDEISKSESISRSKVVGLLVCLLYTSDAADDP